MTVRPRRPDIKILEIVAMQTELLRASDAAIARAAELLRAGQVVGFPTETVYGLGGDALNPHAAQRIFEAKGRPADNPLIVHISSLEQLRALIADELPGAAQLLAQAFWPGPMTLILPRAPIIPDSVSAGLDTVGIRMPSHPVARALIAATGRPIAAPSANRSGRPSPTCAQDVLEDMDGRIPLIIDGGECEIGLESTVIALEHGVPRILRPGAITPEMIRDVLGEVEVDHTALSPLREGETARSPGMKYRHYAPRGKLILIDGEPLAVLGAMRERYAAETTRGHRVALLLPDSLAQGFDGLRVYRLGDTPQQASHRIFAALRQLDRDGVEIAFCQTFDTAGIGLALMNRLDRAAGFAIEHV